MSLITYHDALLALEYVNHVAKMVLAWWLRLMPQPDSEGFHQRSVKLPAPCASAANGVHAAHRHAAATARARHLRTIGLSPYPVCFGYCVPILSHGCPQRQGM